MSEFADTPVALIADVPGANRVRRDGQWLPETGLHRP